MANFSFFLTVLIFLSHWSHLPDHDLRSLVHKIVPPKKVPTPKLWGLKSSISCLMVWFEALGKVSSTWSLREKEGSRIEVKGKGVRERERKREKERERERELRLYGSERDGVNWRDPSPKKERARFADCVDCSPESAWKQWGFLMKKEGMENERMEMGGMEKERMEKKEEMLEEKREPFPNRTCFHSLIHTLWILCW